MIRYKEATFIDGKMTDVYECEKCGCRSIARNPQDKEKCWNCGFSNHEQYKKFLAEQAEAGLL